MLLTLIIIICLLCFVHWYLNCRERARRFWKIPGLPGTFLFGNGLQYFASPEQLFSKLRLWSKTHKNLYRQWVCPFGVINLYNPDDAEILLSTLRNNEKSLLYDFIRPWLKDGLLLSKGSKWQTRRKVLTPAFHFNILRHFTAILEENSWNFIDKMKSENNQDKHDIIPLMSEVTLNSICETAMGTKLDYKDSGDGKTYKKAIHKIGELIIHRIARFWLVTDTIFNLSKAGKDQKKVLQIIHEFPKNIIRERRDYIDKNGIKFPMNDEMDEVNVFGSLKRKMAMLDLLLSAEKDGQISEEGIQEEVDTFMFEGHDTTAMGLTFTLMEIANNRHIQEEIVKELKEVFGDTKRKATMSDLGQLKYLECCIKESLRLYPPVPLISRQITEPITLTDGYVIPAGNTMCHVHIFDLHRRADLFPDPTAFKPERFFQENCIGLHPYAYIPFSAGPRNCIGQRFAMLEMKSVLSAILRNYQLDPITKPSELKFSTDLILRTTHPVYVKFVRKSM